VERRFRYPGRKRLPDREALQGILFVLHVRGPVVVAGVEQVDARVERLLDRGNAFGVVGGAVQRGHPHAAEPERRDGRAGRSEPAPVHPESLRITARSTAENPFDRDHLTGPQSENQRRPSCQRGCSPNEMPVSRVRSSGIYSARTYRMCVTPGASTA
jgi:hypothetical protein